MDDDGTAQITIGELSRRTGLAVRTLRFYSDRGLLVPAARSEAGYRLYDPDAVARVALVRTLRELGVDLPTVARVLDRELGLADVAAAHAARRADPPDLPDDPTPEQIEAWVELAELVADEGFRRTIRRMSERGAADRASAQAHTGAAEAAIVVVQRAGVAIDAGIDPRSPAAAPVLDEIVAAYAVAVQRDDDAEFRAWLAGIIETFADRRAERYWQLLGVINGWPARPATVPAWEWLGAALRG